MNGKITLCLGIHNHQPVGNFESVFDLAFVNSYIPFLKIVEKYPSIKISLHISGALFDWAEKNGNEYFELLEKLVKKGQVEFLTGGYYEPVLSAIPDTDAATQILMHKEYIKKRFNSEAKGLWLTERIWDKTIPLLLGRMNISYTIIDDTHLYYAGLTENEISGFFTTEHLGTCINVFPIDKNLRYLIPFRQPEETIKYLKERAENDSFKVLTYADDGEKFGLWPGTYDWVYKSGYLDRLFSFIEESSEWLKIKTFNEVLDEEISKGIVYIPPASYDEMMEWTLPPEKALQFVRFKEKIKGDGLMDSAKPFIRGGIWENFFAKYPESNIMHKRMLYVSRMKDDIKKTDKNSDIYDRGLKSLFKSQVNCPYWHGLFGGLYLNYLRNVVYSNILEAQKAFEQIKPSPLYEEFDIDTDGENEIFLNGDSQSVLIKPSLSASLMELSYKPKNFNFLSTFSRKFESFHKKAAEAKRGENNGIKSIHDINASKEEGLNKLLIYDNNLRFGFVDHVFDKMPSEDDIYRSKTGSPLFYTLLKKTIGKNSITLIFKNDLLTKKIEFSTTKPLITFSYEAAEETQYLFTEFNFTLLASTDLSRYYLINGVKPDSPEMASSGISDKVTSVSMIDLWLKTGISIDISTPLFLYRYPVETVSQSEEGFERTYQGSCLAFIKDFSGSKKKHITFGLTIFEVEKDMVNKI